MRAAGGRDARTSLSTLAAVGDGRMPPKKGPSAEEKRRMLQEKVMASKSFFNAKELEKMAAGVGIGGMVFKKELQMMIDEDMIVCDKVGAGNYYWKLPGDAANALNKVRAAAGRRMPPARAARARRRAEARARASAPGLDVPVAQHACARPGHPAHGH